ncbi:hypothetical protein E4U41_005428 [Claviceps citrina]|nr:hypothetical protein E4U41_005428 [Claviceps citrina]
MLYKYLFFFVCVTLFDSGLGYRYKRPKDDRLSTVNGGYREYDIRPWLPELDLPVLVDGCREVGDHCVGFLETGKRVSGGKSRRALQQYEIACYENIRLDADGNVLNPVRPEELHPGIPPFEMPENAGPF